MDLLLIILLIILAIDAFSAYWVAKRIVGSMKDSSKAKVYKWISFGILFLVFGAVSLYVVASNIRLQR
jgi:hypothetical protein